MAQTIGREALVDSPQARVDAWLERFEAALTARDVETAARMFATESYWRDLVAFTWNIKTVEGREGVADLRASGLKKVKDGLTSIDEINSVTVD